MMSAAKIWWPDKKFVDDNEVDALFLLDLARQEYGGVANC